jgi:hypothetical protein
MQEYDLELIGISIFALILLRAGKIYYSIVLKKIAESERWPIDDWGRGIQRLAYISELSREEAIKRANSIIFISGILFLVHARGFSDSWDMAGHVNI